MSSVLWLYQTKGLIIIYAPSPDVTRYSYKEGDTLDRFWFSLSSSENIF